MFKLLVSIGLKQIEVAFVGASQTDYDFVRYLIETPGMIPDDVTIQVCAPCREDAVKQAAASLHGAKQALLFTYIGASDNLRENVLHMTEDEWIERSRSCAAYARSLMMDGGPYAEGTSWSFSFGFEDFPNARMDAVVRCAEAVKAAWRPTESRKMYFGVASSVEVTSPNIFADQCEYFMRHLSQRETYYFNVHPHNDRGCAVAAAELACLAGADRVDGCIFGNGERAGNVDIIVVALNFLSQGLDPKLDFSKLDEAIKTYEDITKMHVHPRTPYSGDLYFRAFSGLHQDAILKGIRARNEAEKQAHSVAPQSLDGQLAKHWPTWRVPYLPIDPADLGRSLDHCVFDITSQSGRGGIEWILQQYLGLKRVPLELVRAFSKVVKELATRMEESGHHLSGKDVCREFLKTYRRDISTGPQDGKRLKLPWKLSSGGNTLLLDQVLRATKATLIGSTQQSHRPLLVTLGPGNQLHAEVTFEALQESSLEGSIIAYAKCRISGMNENSVLWGVGVDNGQEQSAAHSILSAISVISVSTIPLDHNYCVFSPIFRTSNTSRALLRVLLRTFRAIV